MRELFAGTVALLAGLLSMTYPFIDTTFERFRLESIPLVAQFGQISNYQGQEIFLQGRIENTPSLVIYERYAEQETSRRRSLNLPLHYGKRVLSLISSSTPSFHLKLEDGVIKVLEGYRIGRKEFDLYEQARSDTLLLVSLNPGDEVVALGKLTADGFKATNVYAGTKEDFINSKLLDSPSLGFLMLGGAISALLGVFVLFRALRS